MSPIDDFWINHFFACSQDEYFNHKNTVCQHSFLRDYTGFFVLHINDKFMISAPGIYVDSLKEAVEGENTDFFDSSVWEGTLKDNFDSIIGPAWIGYYRQAQPVNTDPRCRALNLDEEEERNLLQELKKQCDATEWSHSSINTDSEVIIVKIIDQKIVSAASYKLWGENIAQIGILTHPQYRGNGYAKNVLNALTTYGLERNLHMQYRTLSSNIAAVKVAKACNYDFFAEHISVRVR